MTQRPLLVFGVVLLVFFPRTPPSLAQALSAKRPPFKSPLGLAIDPTGQRAYVTLRTAGSVAVVDLKAHQVIREVPVGQGPGPIRIEENGKADVCCVDSAHVVSLDLTTLAVTPRFQNVPDHIWAELVSGSF